MSLSGTLNVNLINGFSPASGNAFQVIAGGSLSGTFSTINVPSLGGSLQLNPVYSGTDFQLQTVNNATTPPVLAGWSYYRSLTDANGTSLTNFVTKVALTSSNFDFTLAKPDGSDLRVYDATTGAVLPIWLPDYNSVARTATVYYLATNTERRDLSLLREHGGGGGE